MGNSVPCCSDPGSAADAGQPASRPRPGLVAAGVADAQQKYDLDWFIHEDPHKSFDFKRKLGQGAYGEVTLVARKIDGKMLPYQTKPGQQFAIKQILADSLDGDDLIGAFKQECDLQLHLIHPNICQLFSVYSTPNMMFMVTELVDGGDLFDGIMAAEGNVLSEHFAARVIRKSCEALSFMHQHSVAHRDIKPENIMLLNDAATNPLSYVVKLGECDLIASHLHVRWRAEREDCHLISS